MSTGEQLPVEARKTTQPDACLSCCHARVLTEAAQPAASHPPLCPRVPGMFPTGRLCRAGPQLPLMMATAATWALLSQVPSTLHLSSVVPPADRPALV